ncbi:MAG: hypothetical protein O2856_10885 [Planctomycetota bacterium]|nr:hypothetical protein [Planctomycetota bacterium]
MQDNPYGESYFQKQAVTTELKHSGVGIASFVICLLSSLSLLVLIGIAGYMGSQSPGGMDEEDPATIVLGLAVIGSGMGQFLSLLLGVVALFQPNRKKVFAILGTVFSLLAVLLFGGLMVLGALMAA